jgi:hypothetical protein
MARKIALSLGLFVAFLPYLGFPEALDTVLYTTGGLIIAFLAWSGTKPAPTSTIEEMEGELQHATDDGDTSNELKEKESVTEEKKNDLSYHEEEVQHHDHDDHIHKGEGQSSSDKMVSVAFAKHRSHNLKKRITQEGPQLPT